MLSVHLLNLICSFDLQIGSSVHVFVANSEFYSLMAPT